MDLRVSLRLLRLCFQIPTTHVRQRLQYFQVQRTQHTGAAQPYSTGKSRRVVFFNLDTTGLPAKGKLPDMILLAAIYREQSFERYIVPPVPIAQQSTEITGFTANNGKLFLNGVKMETVPLKNALRDFLMWLGHVGCDDRPILISHYGKYFHAPILCNNLRKSDLLETAKKHIGGFADSQEIARDVVPVRDVGNYNLITLAEKFLADASKTHNSVHRVRVLKSLYETTLGNKVNIENYCFTAREFFTSGATARECLGRTITARECLGRTITARECLGRIVTARECMGRTITARECLGRIVIARECLGRTVTAKECCGREFTAMKCFGREFTAKECCGREFTAMKCFGREFTAMKCFGRGFTARECCVRGGHRKGMLWSWGHRKGTLWSWVTAWNTMVISH